VWKTQIKSIKEAVGGLEVTTEKNPLKIDKGGLARSRKGKKKKKGGVNCGNVKPTKKTDVKGVAEKRAKGGGIRKRKGGKYTNNPEKSGGVYWSRGGGEGARLGKGRPEKTKSKRRGENFSEAKLYAPEDTLKFLPIHRRFKKKDEGDLKARKKQKKKKRMLHVLDHAF